ncbi:MAG: response regulator [Desulfobacterales bacterium]|nr:response regulator [Desulfobacterales bacterium]
MVVASPFIPTDCIRTFWFSAKMHLVNSKRTDTMADTVLVVDDDSNIREVLHKFFTLKGYEVVLAASGEQALELAKCEMPKAILLDINMPGIDGMETCKRLRADEKTRLIPIILITAYGASKTEANDVGADDIIYKPFDMKDLSVRLQSVIRVGHIASRWERLRIYMDELEKNRSELVLEKIEKRRNQLANSCD